MDKGQYQLLIGFIIASVVISIGILFYTSETSVVFNQTTSTTKTILSTTSTQSAATTFTTYFTTSSITFTTTTSSGTTGITTETSTTASTSTTTTATPECRCSWFVCNQYCGSKSGNYCLFESNCLEATTSTSTSSTTTSTTSSTPTTTTTIIDNTQKCITAGGTCKQNCDSATADSASSNFLQDIINWLLGPVFGISSMQEIGSYPEYCTQQLPKCCKTITTTTTSSTTSSTSTTTKTTTTTTSTTTTTKPPTTSSTTSTSTTTTTTISNCVLWSGQGSLQKYVNDTPCVHIKSGQYVLNSTVYMKANRILEGDSDVVLLPGNSNMTLIVFVQSNATLRGFRTTAINGNIKIDLVIAVVHNTTENALIENMTIDGAQCDGIDMGGVNTTAKGNIIENNGFNCRGATGAGIYADGHPQQYSNGPKIINNIIRNNADPIDINTVDNGQIIGNRIYGNGGAAGVSLYLSRNWIVENNTISHPQSDVYAANHPYCFQDSGIKHSAAILLCQDKNNSYETTGNMIKSNNASSYYGIVLVGADEPSPSQPLNSKIWNLSWVPHLNIIENNDVHGSVGGCLDDLKPGQWVSKDNQWNNNNCRGMPNTLPGYI